MNRNIKKLLIIALVSMSSVVTACGNTNNVSNKEDALEGKITIVAEKQFEPQLVFASNSFKKAHPKVEINIKTEEDVYNNLDRIIKEKDVDMIGIEDQYIQFTINKFPQDFLDVTEYINPYKGKILKNKINNLTYKDRIYGFPWSSSPKIILYKKDLFEKEGINVEDIKTWDDYINIGEKIKKDTGKKLIANVQDENNNLPIVLANLLGTSYFNNNKINFNSEEWARVSDTIKQLYSNDLVYDTKSYSDTINKSNKGEIASFVADPQYISYMLTQLQNDKGSWGVMKIPAFESGGNRDSSVGGLNLMINKKSGNTALAREFIKYILTDEHMQLDEMKTYGVFPVNTDIYNLVAFNNQVDYFNSKIWYIFSQSEIGAYGVNYTRYFPNISDTCRNYLSNGTLKSKDTKSVLGSLQEDCDKIINGK